MILPLQELLSQMEDNLQNVSAKAISSEVLCNANSEKIKGIETGLVSQLKNIRDQIQHNREEIRVKSLTSKAEEFSTKSTTTTTTTTTIATATTIKDNSKSDVQTVPAKLE